MLEGLAYQYSELSEEQLRTLSYDQPNQKWPLGDASITCQLIGR